MDCQLWYTGPVDGPRAARCGGAPGRDGDSDEEALTADIGRVTVQDCPEAGVGQKGFTLPVNTQSGGHRLRLDRHRLRLYHVHVLTGERLAGGSDGRLNSGLAPGFTGVLAQLAAAALAPLCEFCMPIDVKLAAFCPASMYVCKGLRFVPI